MELGALLDQLRADGTIQTIARNPRAQFGLPTRQYLGAQLLPERTVTENAYREEGINYRTIIANDGSRYSPVQRKKGEMVGSFDVALGDSDIGREFTGKEYDTLMRIIGKAPMSAVPRIIDWVDIALNRALVELCEKQRWEAMINGSVVRKGNNGWRETITYPNPTGHRVSAAGTWSNNDYDPYADIVAMVNLLDSKGFTVTRMITRRPVISILSGNAFMRQRVGLTTLSPGVLAGLSPGFTDVASINGILGRDGLPPFEEYNLQYRTLATSSPFLPGNSILFACQTGRDESLDFGDQIRLMPDTLGYEAVGVPTGEPNPGRVIKLFNYEDRPPRIEGQAWQTTLPVITEPEAFGVILNIT